MLNFIIKPIILLLTRWGAKKTQGAIDRMPDKARGRLERVVKFFGILAGLLVLGMILYLIYVIVFHKNY